MAMRRTRQFREYRLPPRQPRSRGLHAATWVSLGLLALIALGALTVLLAERIALPGTRVLGGTLRPDSDPAVVILPAGVPLDRVLVSPGEPVRAGQTVALFDRAAIAAELAHLERAIVAAAAYRECLLSAHQSAEEADDKEDSRTPSRSKHGPATSPDLDPETELLVRAALETCQTEHAADALARARIEAASLRIAERISLLDRKIALLLERSDERTPRSRAADSLEAALERNALARQRDTLDLETRALRIDQHRARLARIREAGQEIADLRLRQARLAAALERPRLVAPDTGTVARVRVPPTGSPAHDDIAIAEIRPAGHTPYRATVPLSPAQAARLHPGTRVAITLLGFPPSAPRLEGVVERFSEASSESGLTRIIATVALTEESAQILADPDSGIALRGSSTASTIALETPPKPVAGVLAGSLEKALHVAPYR